VHHLQRGQSERIVWLCEELGLDYELKTYQRNPKTYLSPPELAKLYVVFYFACLEAPHLPCHF